MPETLPEPRHRRWPRVVAGLLFVAVAVFVLMHLIDWATARIEASGNAPLMFGLLTSLLVAYAILMAIPFAPGIEIGVSLLVMKGAAIAPFVFAATLTGLSVAFLAGRFLPYKWLHAVFRDLGLQSACRLLETTEPLDREARLALLAERLPKWTRPVLGAGKYALLAILLNTPGNSVLGGGGGLALLAGLSRLYRTSTTLVVIALAVSPVPLGVWFFGRAYLDTP